MKKDLNNNKPVKGDEDMDTLIERYCPVSESLEESLKQMKLMREGKLPKKTWDEMRKERKLKREKEEYDI